jgi:2-methylcitrate dehydratase PrpD
VRGAQATFEGADGFLRVYLRDRCDRDVLRNGLGEHYEFTELSYKPYPCCRFNHAAIDAAIALRASAGVSAEGVQRIRVGVNRQAYEAVATPIEVRKAPHTIVHAQFSLPYTVATALVDGRVELGHFTEASIRREDILALAQRVDVFVDNDIDREWGRNVSPAELHVEMDNGTAHRQRVDWPLGHPRRPMSASDFDAKAIDCFRASPLRLPEDSSRRLRELVNTLEFSDDVRSLVRVLEPASSRETASAPPKETQ